MKKTLLFLFLFYFAFANAQQSEKVTINWKSNSDYNIGETTIKVRNGSETKTDANGVSKLVPVYENKTQIGIINLLDLFAKSTAKKTAELKTIAK